MAQQAAQHSINPSEEFIGLRQLRIRFLVTDDNSSGTVTAFEVTGGGRRDLWRQLTAITVMHGVDGVLTWKVDGKAIDNPADQDAKVLCVISPAAIGPRIPARSLSS